MTIWHGIKDVNIPIIQCRRMAKKLPGAVLREWEEEDHMGMLGMVGPFLREIVTDNMRKMS